MVLRSGVQVALQAVEGGPIGGKGGLLLVICDAASSGPRLTGRRGELARPGSRGSSRRLSAPATCSLDVGGTAHVFTACQSVAPGFEVYTSLESSAASAALLRLGLQVAAGGGWAGFGMSADGNMVGGQVGVVATDAGAPTGATLAGFALPSHSATRVNAANGSLALTEPRIAAKPDGTILATWAVPLEGTVAAALAGPTRFIYAIGPLSEPGVLESHARGGDYPYGDVNINLVAA